MHFNKDKKFDIQLESAEIQEKKIAEIFTSRSIKIEVKSESHLWAKTGNIAIEYENYGKKSGIASTEADWWCHQLLEADGKTTKALLMFPVDELKRIARKYLNTSNDKVGGDNTASKMVVIPLKELFK